jgi:hypothetical protein
MNEIKFKIAPLHAIRHLAIDGDGPFRHPWLQGHSAIHGQVAPELLLSVKASPEPSPCLHYALIARNAPLRQLTQTAARDSRSFHPSDPSQRKFLSLGSTERGIASMSAGDEALRNAMVNMQKAQRFCILAESPIE